MRQKIGCQTHDFLAMDKFMEFDTHSSNRCHILKYFYVSIEFICRVCFILLLLFCFDFLIFFFWFVRLVFIINEFWSWTFYRSCMEHVKHRLIKASSSIRSKIRPKIEIDLLFFLSLSVHSGHYLFHFTILFTIYSANQFLAIPNQYARFGEGLWFLLFFCQSPVCVACVWCVFFSSSSSSFHSLFFFSKRRFCVLFYWLGIKDGPLYIYIYSFIFYLIDFSFYSCCHQVYKCIETRTLHQCVSVYALCDTFYWNNKFAFAIFIAYCISRDNKNNTKT